MFKNSSISSSYSDRHVCVCVYWLRYGVLVSNDFDADMLPATHWTNNFNAMIKAKKKKRATAGFKRMQTLKRKVTKRWRCFAFDSKRYKYINVSTIRYSIETLCEFALRKACANRSDTKHTVRRNNHSWVCICASVDIVTSAISSHPWMHTHMYDTCSGVIARAPTMCNTSPTPSIVHRLQYWDRMGEIARRRKYYCCFHRRPPPQCQNIYIVCVNRSTARMRV